MTKPVGAYVSQDADLAVAHEISAVGAIPATRSPELGSGDLSVGGPGSSGEADPDPLLFTTLAGSVVNITWAWSISIVCFELIFRYEGSSNTLTFNYAGSNWIDFHTGGSPATWLVLGESFSPTQTISTDSIVHVIVQNEGANTVMYCAVDGVDAGSQSVARVVPVYGAAESDLWAVSSIRGYTAARTPAEIAAAWASRFEVVGNVPSGVEIVGSDSITAAFEGALQVSHDLAGSDAVTAQLEGALQVSHALAGGDAITAALEGALSVRSGVEIVGGDAIAAALEGELSVVHALAGSDSITAALEGAAQVAHALAGSDAITAALESELSTEAPAIQIVGGDAITAAFEGDLQVSHGLVGSDAITAALEGELSIAGLAAAGGAVRSVGLSVQALGAIGSSARGLRSVGGRVS